MMIERMRIAVIAVGVSAALLLAVSPALAQRGGGRGGGGGPAGGGRPVAGPTHVVGGPVRGPGPSHVAGPVYGAPRGGYYAYGRYPYAYGYRYPAYAYGPYRYPYPYYSFSPHFSIGFGFSVGYPVAYPYAYVGYPYYGAYYGYPSYYPGYPPYPVYPPSAPPVASYSSQPSTSIQARPAGAVGGLSFEVTPSNAAVFIDGVYVGPVSSFSPTETPLNLSSGKHHVEVRAQGYESMSFEADVTSGQVVPYRGSLQAIK